MTPEIGSDELLIDLACDVESGERDREELLNYLRSGRYPDEPDRRLEAIVDGALDRVAARREVPHTTQPRTAESRAPGGPIRWLTADDVAELSDREFGRLFGLALRQWDAETDVSTGDLREEMTTVSWTDADGAAVAAVVTRRRGGTLSERQVEGIADLLAVEASEGERTALITNAEVDADTAAFAAESGMTVCDRRHLDGILSLARIPPAVYGEALESGENTTFDWGELDDRLPAPPIPLAGVDPLDAAAVRERSALQRSEPVPAGQDASSTEDDTSSTVAWQSYGTSQTADSGAAGASTTPGDAGPEGGSPEEPGASTDGAPAQAGTETQRTDSGWEVDESEVVPVDEERLGELHAADSPDTDAAIGGLLENLDDSS